MFAIHYAFQFVFGFFCCGIVVGRSGSFRDLVTTGPSDENQIT